MTRLVTDRISIFNLIVDCALAKLNLVLFIIECIILNKSVDSINICGSAIWECILCLCIAHSINSILSIYGFISEFTVSCRSIKKTEFIVKNIVILCNVILYIWAMVCYYANDISCTSLFKDQYKNLWNVLFVEVIVFYVLLGIFALIIIIFVVDMYCLPLENSIMMNLLLGSEWRRSAVDNTDEHVDV